mmetsp:Transcript_41948/g.84762  ORF Transcript_41948/g.84762 Transcript_41948/m.84762 type:complete len:259 (-) Transcript_41948:1566-2342(-)
MGPRTDFDADANLTADGTASSTTNEEPSSTTAAAKASTSTVAFSTAKEGGDKGTALAADALAASTDSAVTSTRRTEVLAELSSSVSVVETKTDDKSGAKAAEKGGLLEVEVEVEKADTIALLEDDAAEDEVATATGTAETSLLAPAARANATLFPLLKLRTHTTPRDPGTGVAAPTASTATAEEASAKRRRRGRRETRCQRVADEAGRASPPGCVFPTRPCKLKSTRLVPPSSASAANSNPLSPLSCSLAARATLTHA